MIDGCRSAATRLALTSTRPTNNTVHVAVNNYMMHPTSGASRFAGTIYRPGSTYASSSKPSEPCQKQTGADLGSAIAVLDGIARSQAIQFLVMLKIRTFFRHKISKLPGLSREHPNKCLLTTGVKLKSQAPVAASEVYF